MTSCTIHVSSVENPSPNILVFRITPSQDIAHYFLDDRFWVEYPVPISDLPEGVQAIPLLSLICPVAWVVGADIHVPEVDQAFYDALPKIRAGFQAMYPGLRWRGGLVADVVRRNESPTGKEKTATLFSGGLDSVVTYLRKREQHPALISVWGADVALDNPDAWKNVRRAVKAFQRQTDAEWFTLKSNFRVCINEPALNICFVDYLNGGWWGGVEHGLILTGVCAPLTFSLGIGRLYIPSSYSSSSPRIAWGSTPEIDNLIRWADVEIEHDGYELDRQEKTAYFADRVCGDAIRYPLRVCWKSAEGDNCGVCEKCCRTIIGLLLEGLQPENHGFRTGPETLVRVRRKLEGGRWKGFGVWGAYIKRRIPERLDQLDSDQKTFFEWLLHFDIEKHIAGRRRKLRHRLNHLVQGAFPQHVVVAWKLARLRMKQRLTRLVSGRG